MLMRSNAAEQFPQSSPDNAIPQRESGVGLIADRKKREAKEGTGIQDKALRRLGDFTEKARGIKDVTADALPEVEDEDVQDITVPRPKRMKKALEELAASDEKRYGKRRSFESSVPVDVTSDTVMELEDDDLKDMEDIGDRAHINDLRTAKALREHAEKGAQERAIKATRARIDAIDGRIAGHRSATERAKDETAMIEARRSMARSEEASKREASIRESARQDAERVVEARQGGYEQFVARDAQGRVVGLRSDLEQVPIDFSFRATAEGFKRLTEEVKETASLPAKMAQNRLAQIQEETDRWNQQYQETERAMAFHERSESGEIGVPNVFYEAPKESDMASPERPASEEDRIEAKKAEIRAEMAMIESQLKPSNVDLRENRLREDMAVAEAKIETLKGELKMLKKASPEERARLKEDIQEQEGQLRILHEELKAWKKDEDRPKEIRARKQALLGRLQALREELADVDSVDVDLSELNASAAEEDVDLSELNASAQGEEIPVDVDLSGMEEDVDLSGIEEAAAASRGKKKKAA